MLLELAAEVDARAQTAKCLTRKDIVWTLNVFNRLPELERLQRDSLLTIAEDNQFMDARRHLDSISVYFFHQVKTDPWAARHLEEHADVWHKFARDSKMSRGISPEEPPAENTPEEKAKRDQRKIIARAVASRRYQNLSPSEITNAVNAYFAGSGGIEAVSREKGAMLFEDSVVAFVDAKQNAARIRAAVAAKPTNDEPEETDEEVERKLKAVEKEDEQKRKKH